MIQNLGDLKPHPTIVDQKIRMILKKLKNRLFAEISGHVEVAIILLDRGNKGKPLKWGKKLGN